VYENYSSFSLMVEGNPLPAPTDVVAMPVGTSAVNLSWSAVVNAQGYNIYRNGICIAQTKALSYADTGLSADTEYRYSVAAVYNGKEYELSEEVVAVTGKADYSVKVKSVAPGALAVGENILDITMVNNGRYEQKSRSTLLLTTTSPFVTVKTGNVGMSYLPVEAESTKSFVVVVDEAAPEGHVAEFNLNITELYEDKNVWNCPFVLTVGDASGDDTSIGGVAADGNQRKVVYDLSGRRVNNPKAGIYIVDGKKIVVR
jgi:chitodextrinase